MRSRITTLFKVYRPSWKQGDHGSLTNQSLDVIGLLCPWTHRSCGCLHNGNWVNTLEWIGKGFTAPPINQPENIWCLLRKEKSGFFFKGIWTLLNPPHSINGPITLLIWDIEIGVDGLFYKGRHKKFSMCNRQVEVDLEWIRGNHWEWLGSNSIVLHFQSNKLNF